MKIIIPIIAVLSFLAAVWLMLYANRICSTRRRRIRAESHKRKQETTKKMIWVCLINGFAWVWCSYILAALDKPQIAEELSKVALAEIVAPVVVYAVKSVVENLSKNNRWPDKGGAAEDTPEDEDPPGMG